jgi:F-type H+-transporting ATPase subunit gamma
METLRAIRNRIKSVSSTEKITKAMKMVSVSKLRRTQSAMTAVKPYADKSREILASVLTDSDSFSNPYLMPREITKKCFVLFVGNRGLCGSYNSNILHFLTELISKEKLPYNLVVVGTWGKDLFKHLNLPVLKFFDGIGDIPSSESAREVSEYLKRLYISGETDEIILVYQHFRNVIVQSPSSMQLLPVSPEKADLEAMEAADREFIFEPDRATILSNILQLYIDVTVYSVILEVKTGEHAARMTAMTAATDNTEELLAELTLKMNRVRQANITTEINEIVGGASALNQERA